MPADLWLPTPSESAVRRFRKIALRELGFELSDADTLEAATQVLHIQYLKDYVVPGMRRPETAEENGGKAADAPRPRPKVGRPRKAAAGAATAVAIAPASVDASALAPGESVTLYAAEED